MWQKQGGDSRAKCYTRAVLAAKGDTPPLSQWDAARTSETDSGKSKDIS
jgi:hypothetical protein